MAEGPRHTPSWHSAGWHHRHPEAQNQVVPMPKKRKWGSFHYHLSMPPPPTRSLVLSFEDAREVVEGHASQVAPGASETADLLLAGGRILAESITADRDIPPFPRSTRDGYAVCAADLAKLPARLKIIGETKAGPSQLPSPLNRGDALSIMTGAPVPPGSDAVV